MRRIRKLRITNIRSELGSVLALRAARRDGRTESSINLIPRKTSTTFVFHINTQYRICFTWTDQGPDAVEIVDYH